MLTSNKVKGNEIFSTEHLLCMDELLSEPTGMAFASFNYA